MDTIKSGSPDNRASARLNAELDQLLKELEEIERDLNCNSAAIPDLDDAKIAVRLAKEFTAIRAHLESGGADAARAREAIRALVDHVTITPFGEPTDRRGGGAVLVDIEGPISELLGLAGVTLNSVTLPDATCRGGRHDRTSQHVDTHPVTLPDTSECVGHHDRTSRWHISAALEEAYRPNPGAFRLFIDTPSVIAILRAANGVPLNIPDIIARAFPEIPEEPEYAKMRARILNCLTYLKRREAVVQVKIPGRSGVSWKLTKLADDIAIKATLPKGRGRPEAALGNREREKIVNVLIKARRALGTAEITRRHLEANGVEPTETQVEKSVGLVRQWLARLRSDGIIRSIKPQTGYELKWEAVNWTDRIAATSAQTRMEAGSADRVR